MPHRNHVSWASLLSAYNQAHLPAHALSVFQNMFVLDKLQADHFVFAGLVNSCVALRLLRIGRQVHARFLVSCYSCDNVVNLRWLTCMRNVGYARSGQKAEAVKLLREMKDKSLYTWTALVTDLIQSGHFVSAFHLFIEMRKEGIKIIDPFVLSSVIIGSANLVALELGKELHCLVSKLGFESEPYISNALVDMYAKCSDIVDAKTVFCSIVKKDVVSWTSIIVGLAQHGKAKEALSLYDDMISNGVKPNEVTFVGLIYACSHVGLVDKGRDLFKSMVECYGLKPSLQHYTCLLDLYSRSGHLDEAENLLNTMPFEVDEAVWASLLSACKRFGKTQMGIRVADRLMGLGKESEVFHAGETSHSLKDEMSVLLKDLDEEMRRRGYVPDVSFVLRDIGEKDKENQLFWHIERLAVAYGLLKSVPGSVIRVVKNLRVCGDCHTVLKYISSIASREIVVRDASRFHHFKDFKCSCSDFW
ncbi:pentatricopeptide repeat-containing protein [Tanacetum coccineum]